MTDFVQAFVDGDNNPQMGGFFDFLTGAAKNVSTATATAGALDKVGKIATTASTSSDWATRIGNILNSATMLTNSYYQFKVADATGRYNVQAAGQGGPQQQFFSDAKDYTPYIIGAGALVAIAFMMQNRK